jgi:hypothetical protein
MVNIPYITHRGLPGIEHVPFGMHACHFCRNRNDLIAAMVPYFIAGLRENERCLWITAPPLLPHKAFQALRAASGGHPGGCASHPRLRPVVREFGAVEGRGFDVIQFWLEEEERALLTPGDWPTFMGHEQALSARFHCRRIVTICSYARARCNDQQMSESCTRTTARSSARTPIGR